MFFNKPKLAAIQYAGEEGITQACLEAILRLLQYDDRIKEVRVLSAKDKCCLLVYTESSDWVAVKSGFSAGYQGEGPMGFSYILQLLDSFNVEFDEYEIPRAILKRLDQSALTQKDFNLILAARPVRPKRLYEYISDKHFEDAKSGDFLDRFRAVVPFRIVDPRIADLAISFWENPNDKIMTGYKRLEDIVRRRTELELSGSDLFARAFTGESPILTWSSVPKGEQIARGNLFRSAYSAYRNPRAHKEKDEQQDEYLSEFLLLNHLYRAESEAVENA